MKRNRDDIELERLLGKPDVKAAAIDAEIQQVLGSVRKKKSKAEDDNQLLRKKVSFDNAYWRFATADLNLQNHRYKREQDRYVADSEGNIVTRREQ